MHELTTNLEPGNPDGHTVLRYLVEAKQMPLDVAIERVYKVVAKYAAEYRSDQNKLLTGMVVTGVLGLPVFFPFGVPSLLIAGAIGASAVNWQELGAMRFRLKPEYVCLKNSVLLEQFIKWLAEEVKKRRGQSLDSPTAFQADVITTATILAAYEHTVFSVAQGEHLENNASDPILALFVAKLRQSTNQLPSWVMEAFRHLEQAEAQRSAHLDAAYGYMFGNLSANVGQNSRLGAVDIPAQAVEGEQCLGKPAKSLMEPAPTEKTIELPASGLTFNQSFAKAQPIPVDIAQYMAKVPKSTIIAASPRVGKGVVVSMALTHLRQLHPDLEIWLIDPKNEPTELHYWSLIDPDKRCHYDLRSYDVDPSQASELFEAFRIRFNRSKSSRKLLIIDEFVMLNQKCAKAFTDKLKDFIVGICSSGETSPDQGIGRFVWIITQSPYVTDIGFKTKAALTTFQRVFLLNTSSIQLYSLAASASFVPSGQDKEVADLLEVTGRAFYYSRSNSWHPVPDYQMSHSPGDKLKTLVSPTEIEQGKTGEVLPKSEANDLKISDDLAEPLKSLWLFCKKKNDWVTAKDIYVNSMAVLKGKSVKNIRQYLGLLSDKGLGEIDDKDGDKPKSDSAVRFRAY
jgi:hypothetical protein